MPPFQSLPMSMLQLSLNSDEIKGLLVEQLYSPVLWEDSVRTMLELGVTHFIECGPGKVLSGLD